MKVDGALMSTQPADAGTEASRYERYGFDGVLSFEGPHDPFLPLALAAAATEKVDLTTAIAVAFARNPMVCAYMANDLQLISRGRFILGLGSQIRPHIERRFSETWSKPNARMREFVLAIRAIWRAWAEGERLQFRGEFYTHTLMSPFMNPGPNPHGTPRIFLAGFGPRMIRIAGEVADGWIVHPLHSTAFLEDIAVPALQEGLTRAGRDRSSFEISTQTITMIGSNDEEIARARAKARAQIAFYGSTPAYKILLDHHGWSDLQPELNRMTKEGKWLEMSEKITDEMLDVIGVSGTPHEAGRKLRQRNRFGERTSPVLYNETVPDAVVDLLRGLKEGG